jgi:hypothetical protein
VDIYPPHILNLDARWRRVVNNTPRTLYPRYPLTRISPTLRNLQLLVYTVWQQYTETKRLAFAHPQLKNGLSRCLSFPFPVPRRLRTRMRVFWGLMLCRRVSRRFEGKELCLCFQKLSGTILCGTLFIVVAGARVLLRIRAAQHITCVSEHSTVHKSLMIYTAPSSSRRRILVDRYRRTSKWHLTVCAESVGCNEYYLH